MDENSEEPNTDSAKTTLKVGSLESLSKDELITKCKHLLFLSKKAKSAKDDAVTEIERINASHQQSINSLNEKINEREQKSEVLDEMVSNLTESKMALVTKNESLQRQLNLLSNETELMKNTEKSLAEEFQRQNLEKEKLTTVVKKQQSVIEKLTDNIEKEKETFHAEKSVLLENVKELEKRLEQMDEFKSKYRELYAEKCHLEEILKSKENDGYAKELQDSLSAISGEKKSLEIIVEALKSENNALTEKNIISNENLLSLEKEFSNAKKDLLNYSQKNDEFSERDATLLKFQEDLKSIQIENDDFKGKNFELINEISLLNERLSLLNSEKESHLEMISALKTEKSELSEKLCHSQEQILSALNAQSSREEMNSQLEKVAAEKEDLQKSFEKLKLEMSALETEKNIILVSANELKERLKLEEEEKLNMSSENYAKIEKYEKDKVSLISEKDNIKRERDLCQDELHLALQKLNTITQEHNSEKEQFEIYINECKREMENLKRKLLESDAKSNDTLSNLKCENDLLKANILKIEENLTFLGGKKKNLEEKIIETSNEKINLEEKIFEINNEKKNLEEKIIETNNEKKNLEEKIFEINNEKKNLMEKMIETDSMVIESQKKEDYILQLNENLSKQLQEKEILLKKVSSLENENAQVKESEENVCKSEEDIKALLKEMEKNNIALKNEVSDLTQCKDELIEIKEKFDGLKMENAELVNTLDIEKQNIQRFINFFSILFNFESIQSCADNSHSLIELLKAKTDYVSSGKIRNLFMELEKYVVVVDDYLKDVVTLETIHSQDELSAAYCSLFTVLFQICTNVDSLLNFNCLGSVKNLLEAIQLKMNTVLSFNNLITALEEKELLHGQLHDQISEAESRLELQFSLNSHLQEDLQRHVMQIGVLQGQLSDSVEFQESLKEKMKLLLSNFEEEKLSLENSLADFKKNICSLEEKLSVSEIEISEFKNEKLEVVKNYEILQREVLNLKENNDLLKLQKNNLSLASAKLEDNLQSIKTEYSNFNAKYSSILIEHTELTEKRQLLESQVISLESELSEVHTAKKILEREIKSFQEKLSNENDLNTKIDKLEKELEAIRKRCQKCSHCQSNQSARGEEETDQMGVSNDNSDLINELNFMNQELRERGERISRLSDQIRDKTDKIEVLESNLNDVNDKMKIREAELMNKEERLKSSEMPLIQLQNQIQSLKEENANLKKTISSANQIDAEQCQQHSHEVSMHGEPSEVMSTSTISRSEEPHRLKELEDTFEERYMKLKSVAIKMKKKLAEQTANLKSYEDMKKRFETEKEQLLKKSNGSGLKSIQALQDAVDRLQDNLDCKTKELKERDQQLLTASKQLSDLKNELADSQERIPCLQNDLKNKEMKIAEMDIEYKDLQAHILVLENRLEEEHKETVKVKQIQESLEEKLELEKQQKTQVLKELEGVQQEYKKISLFDLEMKDYEKTIEDLSAHLKEKESSLCELQNQFTAAESSIRNLNEQILLMKGRFEADMQREEMLKENIRQRSNEISELKTSNDLKEEKIMKDRRTIEDLIQELEKQKLMVSETTAQNSQCEIALRNGIKQFEKQIEELEKCVTELTEEKLTLLSDLNTTNEKFEVYKVRAQSVLRQKCNVSESEFELLKSERDQMATELESSNLKCQQLQSELVSVRAEIGYMSSEKDRLTQQALMLSEDITKKENHFKTRTQELEEKIRSSNTEYQTIISNMASQSEQTERNFQAQLTNLKESHKKELQDLQSQLDNSKEKLNKFLSSERNSSFRSSPSKPIEEEPAQSIHSEEKHRMPLEEISRIDVTNMIREAAEGSEWVEPSHPQPYQQSHSIYNPPPLEHLLNSPFPPQVLPLDESSSVISATTDLSTKERSRLEEKVADAEMRLSHITSLLTESEAENAKLVQLSDALKEEIRRNSRNKNREKHLENNEYLKNVVLKFLLLKTGDEKMRLVPVLKTILQLSPEETSNLTTIAKGTENNENTTQGWGDYLHVWSAR